MRLQHAERDLVLHRFHQRLAGARVRLLQQLYHIQDTAGGFASGSGSVLLMLRSTIDDPAGGDMTMFDFPLAFSFQLTGNGSVSVTKKIGAMLDVIGQHLPDCTSAELLTMFVRDPNGNVFAVPGVKIK